MSKINEKRESLERFIKEQTLGPGINGFRFIDIENEDTEDITKTFEIKKLPTFIYYKNDIFFYNNYFFH